MDDGWMDGWMDVCIHEFVCLRAHAGESLLRVHLRSGPQRAQTTNRVSPYADRRYSLPQRAFARHELLSPFDEA